MRRALVGLAAALAALVGAAAYLLRGPGPFYDASQAELQGHPGTVIRAEPIAAFAGAKAWRVLYRSSGLKNEPIAVSGVVVAPDDATDAKPDRPIVGWAHPTTGIARKCAPSLAADVLATIPGLQDMVKRGFVVAATDYVGLGTAGTHPYLIGPSAARSVLDSVRAARALTQAGARFAVWGHSQGAHAALWTGKLASDYAPELKLTGVAAAAPPTELTTLFEDDLALPAGQAFASLALVSWSRLYGLHLDDILEPGALRYVDLIGSQCMNTRFDLFIDEIGMRGLKKGFLKSDLTKIAPLRNIVVQNSPEGLPPSVPLLVTQGRKDGLILPAITRNYVAQFCQDGGTAALLEMDAGHVDIGKVSAPAAVAWMADRFAGAPASSTCGTSGAALR